LPGVWDIPGPLSVAGEFPRIGSAKILGSNQGQSGRPVVIPGEAKNVPEEGAFAGIFWRWWDPVLAGVLAKTGDWTRFFGSEVVGGLLVKAASEKRCYRMYASHASR
jgi:hypothetical protein